MGLSPVNSQLYREFGVGMLWPPPAARRPLPPQSEHVIVSNARPAKLPSRARSASIVHSQSAPVTTDPTRAAVDEALRRHSLVFSTIGDGVLVMDLEGRIIDMNPGAERLFGYTK